MNPTVAAFYALIGDANAAVTRAIAAGDWPKAREWTETAHRLAGMVIRERHGRAG